MENLVHLTGLTQVQVQTYFVNGRRRKLGFVRYNKRKYAKFNFQEEKLSRPEDKPSS
jgi:hypothetical protein